MPTVVVHVDRYPRVMADVERISPLTMTRESTPIITEHGSIVIVTVLPEQCVELARTIEPFITTGKTGVVLDLGRVSFLDSVSIAAIIGLRNRLLAIRRRFAVANLAPNIQAVFRILKLDRMFDLGFDLEQAIADASLPP